VVDAIKWGMGCVKDGVWAGLSALHPSNIKEKYNMVRNMTWKERTVGFIRLNSRMAYAILWLIIMMIW
jgi:hypothetical protein